MAGEHPIVETRKLLANAVRFLTPAPRIRVEAPANVEVVVTIADVHEVIQCRY